MQTSLAEYYRVPETIPIELVRDDDNEDFCFTFNAIRRHFISYIICVCINILLRDLVF